MHIAAGKSHSSRRLMVSTAVTTLFRAQREATFVADTTQPALNVVFCLTATGTPRLAIYTYVVTGSYVIKSPTFLTERGFSLLHQSTLR